MITDWTTGAEPQPMRAKCTMIIPPIARMACSAGMLVLQMLAPIPRPSTNGAPSRMLFAVNDASSLHGEPSDMLAVNIGPISL